MIILPATDIKNGMCVRLRKGDFSTAEKVAVSPAAAALDFEKQGAEYIHIVDLDGAVAAESINRDVIISMINTLSVPCEIGGGIRDMKTAEFYINGGADRIILGSAAVKDPAFTKECINEFGDKVAIGIDAFDGIVKTEGWLSSSGENYIDAAKRLCDMGAQYIIYTDISRDGMQTGVNIEHIINLQNAVPCNIIASGGVGGIDDIKELYKANVYGVICGKALYSGSLSLTEALAVARGE